MFKNHTPRWAALTCAALTIAACGGSDSADVEVNDSERITEDSVADPPGTAAPDTAAPEPSTTDAPDEPADTADEPVTTDQSGDYANPESLCATKVDDGVFEPIDCDQPHDAEFAGYSDPSEGFNSDPDAEAIRVARACGPAVEELVERPMSSLGIDTGAALLGDGVIQCWAVSTAEESLTGLIADIGLDAALGDNLLLPDLELGTCFLDVDDDSYEVVAETSCDDLDAQQLFAFVTLDDREFPGDDAVVDEAFAKCDEALAATTVDVISQAYVIVYPADPGWTAFEQRTVSCSAVHDDSNDTASAGIWDAPASYEWGVDEPVCLQENEDDDDNDNASSWTQVGCEQPHTDELLAVVEAPFAVLPPDVDQAVAALHDLCNPFMEAQTTQRRELPGLNIGFAVTASPGTLIEGPVACFASTGDDPFLVGSLTTASVSNVLGDIVVIADLAPGTCFEFPGESFTLGRVADCTDPGALIAVGTYQLDEVDGRPVLEDQRAERLRKCTALYEASGLSGDVDTLSGTFPSDESYLNDGERLATCDMLPA